MDYGGLLTRAWRITWDNKYLWWLGFLVALGSGEGANVNRTYNQTGQFGGMDRTMPAPGFPAPGTVPPGPGALPEFPFDSSVGVGIIALICLFAVIAFAVWVVSTVARGGLISATNQIEDTEKSSLREGWSAGVEIMWRMLGVALVQGIPGLVLVVILFLLFVAGMGTGFFTDPSTALATGGAALLCLIPLMCIAGLATLALSILRPFADRACTMEGESVFAAYRRGWEVLSANFVESLAVGVILFVTRLVTGFVVSIPFLILAFVLAATLGFGAVALDAGPEAIITPAIVAGICGLLVFVPLAAVVGAVVMTFFSGVWTLAYRQFTGYAPGGEMSAVEAPAV